MAKAKPGPVKGNPYAGRARSGIDWDKVAKLAANFNPVRDIAWLSEVAENTLRNCCPKETGMAFDDFVEKSRSGTRNKLRLLQIAAAEKGNITMMIWLGKQLLGQTDKVDQVDKYWSSKKGKEELMAMGTMAMEVISKSMGAAQVPPAKET